MRAARLDDKIGHTLAREGLIGGAVAGAVVGAVVGGAAIVAGVGLILSAPLSLPLLIGGALLASTGIGSVLGFSALGAWIGESVGSLSFVSGLTSRGFTGKIDHGSPDVFINSKQAARVAIDTAPCMKDPPVVALIAMGSSNVFINDHPAARVDDKVSCGAIIKEGSENVYIGGEQEKFMDVEEEVPDWMHKLVFGAGIAGALMVGGIVAAPALILAGGLGVIGGSALGQLGRSNGEWLSERFGGLPSDWEKLGTFLGEGIGGWLGVKGAKIADRIRVDPNTLGSNLGNSRLRQGRRRGKKGNNSQLKLRQGPKHGQNTYQSTAKPLKDWLKDYPNILKYLRQQYKNNPEWQGIDPDTTPVYYRTPSEVAAIRAMPGESNGHHPHGLALGGPRGQKLTTTNDTKNWKNPQHKQANDIQNIIKDIIKDQL